MWWANQLHSIISMQHNSWMSVEFRRQNLTSGGPVSRFETSHSTPYGFSLWLVDYARWSPNHHSLLYQEAIDMMVMKLWIDITILIVKLFYRVKHKTVLRTLQYVKRIIILYFVTVFLSPFRSHNGHMAYHVAPKEDKNSVIDELIS